MLRNDAYEDLVIEHVPKQHLGWAGAEKYTLSRGKKFIEANTVGFAGRPKKIDLEKELLEPESSWSKRIRSITCGCGAEFTTLKDGKDHESLHRLQVELA